MVVTNKLYSPQEFVEVLTGKYYIIDGDNDIDEIHELLCQNGVESEENPLWDYPLNEIDHIALNDINVVLVDVMIINDDDEFEHELRWFEIHEECIVNFKEDTTK